MKDPKTDSLIELLDKQIKELQEKREELWRAKTITLGELLDLSDSLEEELDDRKWYTSLRVGRIIRRL